MKPDPASVTAPPLDDDEDDEPAPDEDPPLLDEVAPPDEDPLPPPDPPFPPLEEEPVGGGAPSETDERLKGSEGPVAVADGFGAPPPYVTTLTMLASSAGGEMGLAL